jgi:transmembrane sensor
MDQEEQKRLQQLMEQYLNGSTDSEAIQRFNAWYREVKADKSLDLSKEDVNEAVQRMSSRLRAATHPKVVPMYRKTWFRITGVAAAVLLLITLSYTWLHKEPSIVVATLKGESKVLTLPDGTRIHLNENSTLTYTGRNTDLQGEAYFEVAKDQEHPFKVRTNKASITVLGTSFNVSESRADSGVMVAVKEGLISLQSANGKMLLSAGQAAMATSTGQLTPFSQANVDNYLSWMKGGQLNFDSTPLADVVKELQAIYHVPIRLDNPGLEKIRLTLQYKHAPLPVLLNVICNSLELQYATVDGTIVLQPMQ